MLQTETDKAETSERGYGSGKALIVSGGSIEREFALALLKEHDFQYIIGADAGLLFLYQEKITPTHIVGDFDSLDQEILENYVNNPNLTIRIFSPIKDKTDTEIALHLCIELGAKEIWLLGWNGARVDHTIGNLQALAIPLEAGIPCTLADECNEVRLLNRGITLKKETAFGKYLSLFPFDGTVEGLTVTGVKYPLKNHCLVHTDTLGVSNEITGDTASISFSKGRLLMVMSRDRGC